MSNLQRPTLRPVNIAVSVKLRCQPDAVLQALCKVSLAALPADCNDP
jgi:hypothetical protein